MDPVFDTALVKLGSVFMIGPEMATAAEPLGIPGPLLYFRGRVAPVPGCEDADRAAEVMRIFPVGMLRHVWKGTAGVAGFEQGYRAAAARVAERLFSGVAGDDLEQVAEAADQVLAAADLPDVDATAITRAWRDLPSPTDQPARAYWALVMLRELRGSRHFLALDEVGLSASVSGLVDPAFGAAGFARLGWRPEQVEQLRAEVPTDQDQVALREAAIAATDAAFEADLAVLTTDQRDLVAGVIRSGVAAI